jgi:hypothetical protein
MLYAGRYGTFLRDVMRRAICEALGLGYGTVSQRCTAGTSEARLEDLVLVTESLGSKMVFDALRDLLAPAAIGRPDSDPYVAIEKHVASIRQVYMLAN